MEDQLLHDPNAGLETKLLLDKAEMILTDTKPVDVQDFKSAVQINKTILEGMLADLTHVCMNIPETLMRNEIRLRTDVYRAVATYESLLKQSEQPPSVSSSIVAETQAVRRQLAFKQVGSSLQMQPLDKQLSSSRKKMAATRAELRKCEKELERDLEEWRGLLRPLNLRVGPLTLSLYQNSFLICDFWNWRLQENARSLQLKKLETAQMEYVE